VDRVAGDSKELGDRCDGVLHAGEQVPGVTDLFLGHGRRTAEAGATGAGCVQALVGVLHDEFADELRECREHVEDQAPAWGGGVERLVERGEADAMLAQAGDKGDEVPNGAAEPIEGRDDEGVPFVGVVEVLPQFLALRVPAGPLVGDHPIATCFGEGVDLPLEQLSLGRGAGVPDERAPHGGDRGEEIGGVVVRRRSPARSGRKRWP
jgi:hypothetical protein